MSTTEQARLQGFLDIKRTVFEWQDRIHAMNVSKGFHSTELPENVRDALTKLPEDVAGDITEAIINFKNDERIWKMLGNIHGEASEAWEDARNPNRDHREVYDAKTGELWLDASDAVQYVSSTSDPVDYAARHRAQDRAVEAALDGRKPDGMAVELADIIIRCLDTAHALGLDLEAAMAIKFAYNSTRGFRHGGKRA